MGTEISRSEFIRRTGLVAGAVSAGFISSNLLSSCGNSKPIPLDLPKDKIRLGMIGTGQRFVEQIVLSLKYLPNFEVMACADINPNHLQNGLKYAAPGAKAYHDYRALLENKDVDAVVVCTPLVSHVPIALDAISAGKHVICEKSMAYSIEQAIELENAVKNSNIAFRISYEFRSCTPIKKIKQIIKDGVLGKITHIEAKWDGFSDWRREYKDPKFKELVNWRLHRKYCGGLMTEKVSHVVDAVNYMLDMHPLKAMSTGSIAYWKDERDTFDNVLTIYEYPDGINGFFSANLASNYDGGFIKIYGTLATVEIPIDFELAATIAPNTILKESTGKVDAVTGASYKLIDKSNNKKIQFDDDIYESYNRHLYSYYAGTVFGYKHFLDMIINNAPPDISVTDGKIASISVLLANMSNRNNTVEYWKPEYDAS